ncbi:MAG: hypothetical protein LC768_18445 [Acidobacteria bacterium]|nr:hypothetical protein [Acidobacteriota bacterium]
MAEVKFMLTKDKSLLWACLLVLLCCAPFAAAQEKEESKKTVQRPSSPTGKEPTDDIVRVNTRVVFIDALVKDKKKDTPVRNLTRDNFTVLDDGQVRELTYFSAGSETRRPRMLMLVLDFFGGDGRAFHDKEIVAGLASVLAKLPPEDEVAIATTWLGRDTSPCSPVEQVSPDFPPLQVLQDFTRDRGKIVFSPVCWLAQSKKAPVIGKCREQLMLSPTLRSRRAAEWHASAVLKSMSRNLKN